MHIASPLSAAPRISERRPGGIVAVLRVDPSEPVLHGHFPGFPIFPGVCLVEIAHQAALLCRPGARLTAIERVRFLAPVFPGDEVIADLTFTGARCTARIDARRPDGQRSSAAVARLRYADPAAL